MRFFIRFFIFILVIAAAAYGYAWYKNKQAIDSIIVANGGSYSSTYIDINGDSVTKGISIPIPGLSKPLTFGEVRTGTGNILTNVKVTKALGSQDLESLPKHFDIYFNFDRAKLPFDPIMDDVANQESNLYSDLTFAGCGTRNDLSYSDLQAAGISALESDARIKLTVDNSARKAFADIYVLIDKFNTTKFNLTFNNFNFNNPLGITVGGGSLELADNGIQREINALCANETALTEKQYTERHISHVKHMLFKENIFLSPEFYTLYEKYHGNPRSIKLYFQPTDSLQPLSLMSATPRRLVSLLNANVSLNDQAVTPLFGNRPDPSELPQLDVVTPEEVTVKTILGLKVQDTPVSDIGKYVGYDTYFNYRGKEYKGEIRSVRGSTANIRYEISTGNYVEKPFRIRDISDLRVRREQVQPTE